MKICKICGKRIARSVCRRCGAWICTECHFHHGLCRRCAKSLGKLK